MAHTCPTCGCQCHCGGDIDDINFGELFTCTCCEDECEGEYEDDWDVRNEDEV
jgi:hypothetical protein